MTIKLLLLLLVGCDTSVPQSEACAQWVACIDARDDQLGVETDNDRFLANGPCWGNPEIGHLCDDACTAGLELMPDLYSDLPEECL